MAYSENYEYGRVATEQLRCDYCGQFIRAGAKYDTWECIDDEDDPPTAIIAHPECRRVDWGGEEIDFFSGWRGVDYDDASEGCDWRYQIANTDLTLESLFAYEKYNDGLSGCHLFTWSENDRLSPYALRRTETALLHRFMSWLWSLPLPLEPYDAMYVIEACEVLCSEVLGGRDLPAEDKTAFWEMLTGYDHPTQPNTPE
jgi:hypothetical protein